MKWSSHFGFILVYTIAHFLTAKIESLGVNVWCANDTSGIRQSAKFLKLQRKLLCNNYLSELDAVLRQKLCNSYACLLQTFELYEMLYLEMVSPIELTNVVLAERSAYQHPIVRAPGRPVALRSAF